MAIVTSSPLGITLGSTVQEQQSSYIRGYKNAKELGIDKSPGDSNLYRSIFGNSLFSAFPQTVDLPTPTEKEKESYSGNVTAVKAPDKYHASEQYDTSITSLIDYTKGYKSLRLLASDFAYLKDVGVFPNNRLMIARRFAGPVKDDLTSYGSKGPTPLATLISWTPDGNDFISISFGEEWEEAESSFKDVLNDIGKDMKASQDQGSGLGNLTSKAFGAIPLPGFMEGLQYEVLNKMGLSDDKSVSGLPGGNPNLIREAKRRKTLAAETAGSGLKADVSITMTVEYEQKFINGVDPTLVYYDIIANALSFGTSQASFQFSGAFGAGISKTLQQFISGDIKGIIAGIKTFVTSLINAIAKTARQLIQALISPPGKGEFSENQLVNAFIDVFKGTVGAVIGKYKIRIQGIANALSGAYSTPWHITIGNPKKPLFSSGDMLTTDVKMTLGPILAFNDLPSSIKLEFTLKNARNLGAQEIFNKFNASGGRTYKRLNLSFGETKLTSSTQSSDYAVTEGTTVDESALDGKINIEEYFVFDREGNEDIPGATGSNQQSASTAENRQGSSGTVDPTKQGNQSSINNNSGLGESDSDPDSKRRAEELARDLQNR